MRRIHVTVMVMAVVTLMVAVAAPAMAREEELLVACDEVIRTADTGTVFCSADDDEFGRAPTFECEETFRVKGTTYCPVDAEDAFKQFVIDEEFRKRVGPLG
jgi:hypothetical protein